MRTKKSGLLFLTEIYKIKPFHRAAQNHWRSESELTHNGERNRL